MGSSTRRYMTEAGKAAYLKKPCYQGHPASEKYATEKTLGCRKCNQKNREAEKDKNRYKHKENLFPPIKEYQLACGHAVQYRTTPKAGDYLYCYRCEDWAVYQTHLYRASCGNHRELKANTYEDLIKKVEVHYTATRRKSKKKGCTITLHLPEGNVQYGKKVVV